MHYLQRNILKVLAFKPRQSFSDLKPDNISNSQFSYHLKQLVKNEYVIKRGDAYQLSPKGGLYVDKLSFKNFAPREQPKVVNILHVINEDGETLLYERKHEPYKGYVGLPSGKTHMGERFVDSAKRELLEKAGLEAELELTGIANIQINKADEIVSHIYGFVFMGEANDIKLDNSHPKGRVFWGNIEEHEQLIPGSVELINKIKNSKELFVFDNKFQIE